jgi:hypothetical protein
MANNNDVEDGHKHGVYMVLKRWEVRNGSNPQVINDGREWKGKWNVRIRL